MNTKKCGKLYSNNFILWINDFYKIPYKFENYSIEYLERFYKRVTGKSAFKKITIKTFARTSNITNDNISL